jgi:uncharacterized protein (DUF1697 family)
VNIALLRGINVGKAKRVAMADLRAIVEALGYRDVKTILNSGNIVFSSAHDAVRSAKRIEEAMVAELGISSRIIGLSSGELEDVISRNPLPDATSEPSRFLIAIVRDSSALAPLQKVVKQEWGSEVLALGKREAWMWCPSGILEGKLVEAVGRALGDTVTTRNWATLLRIREAASSIS